MSGFIRAYIVGTKPHPLLCPDENEGYQAIRNAMEQVRREIEESDAELLVIYSTKWLSILGHQMQADPKPEWTYVDPEWHALGSIPYSFRMDPDYAKAYVTAAEHRGLHARTVAYHGFPIDTGTVVALKLLNPDNRIPASVVSCNMYADRAETLVLGKAARDAVEAQGKKAIAIAVTQFSNRMHTEPIELKDDRISALKDDEWNRKMLEFLGEGRLEDVSQLARQFFREANADQKLKAMWWLAAAMGQHNNYRGEVLAYAPVYGTGTGIVRLEPGTGGGKDLEFDEDDVEVYRGDRNVLAGGGTESLFEEAPSREHSAVGDGTTRAGATVTWNESPTGIESARAPKPVGAYPHARRVGDFLFLSGVGPRSGKDNSIPGGPVRDEQGAPRDYDIEAQTRAVIENVRTILEDAGTAMEAILDVQVFLIDMDRDFAGFNATYKELMGSYGATRTTIAVRALPTPIAVEFKVIAEAQRGKPAT